MLRDRRNKDQKWFNDKFSNKEVINIKKLNFPDSLKIESFTNLKSISLKKLNVTRLEISNCSKLDTIYLSELAILESISVNYCNGRVKLNCCSCKGLTELDVSNLI